MAAPAFVYASTGATDAGGAWSFTCDNVAGSGEFVIVQIMQDGATTGAVAQTAATNVNNLAGSAGWTYLGEPTVGGYTIQHIFFGRSTAASPTISGTNSTSEDLYFRAYVFSNVSDGTTLATVIEDGTAGAYYQNWSSDDTVEPANITTLGPDRLALTFVGLGDDYAIGSCTGETGGDWTEAVAEYAESSGTDGCVQLQTAAMASAGDIYGGSATLAGAINWSVVGFALIGTTVEAAANPLPRRVYPQLLAG